MVNQNTITIWPPGSNEEPQRGPKPFDAQNVAKFLKNYDDKNLIINPDASGGKLRGLINKNSKGFRQLPEVSKTCRLSQ